MPEPPKKDAITPVKGSGGVSDTGDVSIPSRKPLPTPSDQVVCERCGAEMYRMHAVWRCSRCGFKTDCCGW